MPTSVLLAVLAGAGLLALAPALVRRYDADERMAAELEASQARVLERKTRQTTVPGPNPVNGPSADVENDESGDSLLASETPSSVAEAVAADSAETVDSEQSEIVAQSGWERSGARRGSSVRWEPETAQGSRYGKENSVGSAQMRAWWQKRYRRVLFTLLALNLAEILGVIFIGPGFWLGVGISLAVLLAFVRFLRLRVVRGNAAARREPAAARRRVYVPAQSSDSARDEAEIETDSRIVPGFDDEPEPDPIPEPAAVSRRRTGGIRGRSYESPANL